MTFGVLASGKLGFVCLSKLNDGHKIDFVMTDSKSFEIVDFCNKHVIPFFSGNPRNGKASFFLKQFKTDILLSVNYLFVVDDDVLKFPSSHAINFHGSLLPKYRGRTPHVWAIINDENETGVTAHLMVNECDKGAIILQEKIAILPHYTGADILNDFFSIYPVMIDKVIKMLEEKKIVEKEQDEALATYFGKRVPEDGKINWNWQKRQIVNWVRAQASPYPGAFTFYMDKKIIIHKVAFSDHGFNSRDENGLILTGGDFPIVKTPNGALTILHMIKPTELILNKGDILE